jgi:hypothetical protein
METKANVLPFDSQYDSVKQYYGEVVQKTTDLKTNACCTSEKLPAHVGKVLPLIILRTSRNTSKKNRWIWSRLIVLSILRKTKRLFSTMFIKY